MAVGRCRPTWLDVDLGACVHNLRQILERIRPRDVWPVVKADAYGHGAVRVAQALAREKVAGFCVATASEGRELRQNGISEPILVMATLTAGGTENPFEMVVEYGLSAAVPDATTASNLAEAARAMRVGPASVHLKIDTGMGRLGVSTDQAVGLAAAMRADPALAFDGLFSNLATADEYEEGATGKAFVSAQVDAFRHICAALGEEGNLPRIRTLANSAAVSHHPAAWEGMEFTGVRPGLAIYGASLTPDRPRLALRAAARWCTSISAVRRMPEGSTVGYGCDAVLARPSRIAVLPLGYHDGLPRSVGRNAEVLVRGRRVSLIGRISMDLALADVTDVSAAAAGDEVTIFGAASAESESVGRRESVYADTLATAVGASDGSRETLKPEVNPRRTTPSVEEYAAWAGTIPHEILSRVGTRVPRRYTEPEAGAS
ncbi:MAG: alanine racemase [Acidobacteria bacterium]|nr:alanine racemase [Acidobacteriota bacterium]